MKRWIVIVLLLAGAGCVTMTPEQRLSHELFVEAAHACQSRYHTIHVDLIGLDGSLEISAEAESRSEYRPFIACYHETLRGFAESRRKAGLPVPEALTQEHDVNL